MHDHDNENKGMKSMMWMMVICCAVPLVLILLFGAHGGAFGAPIWVVFGAVAVMVIAHFFMRGRSHKYSDSEEHDMASEDNENKDGKNDNPPAGGHSGHGCCH